MPAWGRIFFAVASRTIEARNRLLYLNILV